jgi:putative hydroxymethylpyrimidine transport system ATP-binding protein
MQNTFIQDIAPTISIHDAYLAFHRTLLFENLNLTLRAGQWTCLLGRSGIGKSTLLRLLANLPVPDSVVRAQITTDSLQSLNTQVAYMAQTDLLLPWLTVLENVLLFTKLKSISAPQKRIFTAQARDLLIAVGLNGFENYYPEKLSGGMRQRVALVRTLIENKPVVLMDEPFSALDTITRFHLQNLAAKWLRNRTVFFVTHDPLEALRLADEIYILSGQPAALMPPLKLTSATPRDPGTTELISLQAKLYRELSNAYEVCV